MEKLEFSHALNKIVRWRRMDTEKGRVKKEKKKWKIELRSKNHPNVSIYFRRVHIYSIN